MVPLLLLACADPPVPELPAAPVYVDARRAPSGGTLALHAPAGSSVESDKPLTVAPTGEGEWALSGEDGSYVVTVTPPAPAAAVKLYLDVGVDGPTGGELDDVRAVPPPPPPMWPWIAGGVAAGIGAVALGVWAWRRYAPAPPPPPPDPPHVIARRAWAALRQRTDLPPEAVAGAMSEIFRTWIDAAWGFPATRRTTREILDNLAGSLTAVELESSRRLLTATDLVKFAERSEHANLFERLDRDFEALVKPVRRA